MSLEIDTRVSELGTLDNEQTNTITSASAQQRLQMIGSITHLMMCSELHRKYPIFGIA